MKGFIEDAYLDLIKLYSEQHCQLIYAGICRQSDQFSCITDAFVILKDALRKDNLIQEIIASSKEDDCAITEGGKSYKASIAPLPLCLYKTAQNKQLLDALTIEELQTPLISIDKNLPNAIPKTLAMHLEKYNLEVIAKIIKIDKNVDVSIEEKNWQINTYLQIKGYRMLVNAAKLLLHEDGKITQDKQQLVQKHITPDYC